MAYYDYFEKSTPIAAKGGIKAQSKRGEFASSWWAKRWIEVLESFNLGARLTRGRSYARKGQVLSIDIKESAVTAKVQGSRPTPYKVEMTVKPLSEKEWSRVADVLSQQALFAARLLAGEMPQNIGEAFKEAGVSLFPSAMSDISTDCSCPDYSNPCKHIAAVYYLIGEEFDRDPFLIFRLRGKERADLVAMLGDAAGPANAASEPALPPAPLRSDTALFWASDPLPADLVGSAQAPPVQAALPQRLGHFPFWRGDAPFNEFLSPVYTRATPIGQDMFTGQHVRVGGSTKNSRDARSGT